MGRVITQTLKIIENENGPILHALKSSEQEFCGFGEAYFSEIKKGCIKGWKKHLSMTLNITVPIGKIKFVIFDDIENKFFEIVIKNNIRDATIILGPAGRSNSKELKSPINTETIPKNIAIMAICSGVVEK